jgi:Ca2+-dependent lipid-binding protein
MNEKGKAIGKAHKTKVLKDAGASAEWNETITYSTEQLIFPQAYTLKLSVWDKDTFKSDPLGKVDLPLAKVVRSPTEVEFIEKLEGS